MAPLSTGGAEHQSFAATGVGNTTTTTVASAPPPRNAHQRSPRFYLWSWFFLFALIVTGSSIEATDRVQASVRGIKNQRWAVGGSMVSFIISFGVVILHLFPLASVFIVGTRVEGAIAFIMVCLWASLVASLSDSGNGLAVDPEGGAIFGNLYFCGWFGFFCAIAILVNYLKTVFMVDAGEELNKRANRFNLWVACLVSHIVLMSSAANAYDYTCAGGDERRRGTKWCNRAILAIFMGGAGSVASIVISGMKLSTGTAPLGLESLFCTLMFVANCFSCGLVTCEDGPGRAIGNLFFSSWTSMILPFLTMSACFEHWSAYNDEEKKTDLEQVGAPPEPYKGTFARMEGSRNTIQFQKQPLFSSAKSLNDETNTQATGISDEQQSFYTRGDQGDQQSYFTRDQGDGQSTYYARDSSGGDSKAYFDSFSDMKRAPYSGRDDDGISFAESRGAYPQKPSRYPTQQLV